MQRLMHADVAERAALDAKLDALIARLRQLRSVLIGYSGGVDSAFLAAIALDALGRDSVLAVTGLSAAVPAAQRSAARDLAITLGLPHLEIETDELLDPSYSSNPSNRCYFCKTELWSKLGPIAREHGLAAIVDGANADDAHDHRPGALAAREHGVRSPLLEVGLAKAEIRVLSRERGLDTWDRPAAPCLASRLPYGVSVTPERLTQVERAEDVLARFGFREYRVRHHDDTARIEVAPSELARALSMAEQLHAALSAFGFANVVLDVEGYRRGALNESLVTIGGRG